MSGAWEGGGPDNHDAMDLFRQLERSPDFEPIAEAFRAALRAGNDYLEAPEAARAIAAAEVVAALLGNPTSCLPKEIAAWVSDKEVPGPWLVKKARQVVQRLLKASESKELWDEKEGPVYWRRYGESLLQRLNYRPLYPCPVCGQLTDSLKQYRYVNWFLTLVHPIWWEVIYRACPNCMRRFIGIRCLMNIIPANVFWLVCLFPWALCLFAASYRPGHSAAVLRGVTPEMVMEPDEFSWGRIAAIISLLFWWIPLIGLGIAGLAFIMNRRSAAWMNKVSLFALIASGFLHAGFAVLLVADLMRG